MHLLKVTENYGWVFRGGAKALKEYIDLPPPQQVHIQRLVDIKIEPTAILEKLNSSLATFHPD